MYVNLTNLTHNINNIEDMENVIFNTSILPKDLADLIVHEYRLSKTADTRYKSTYTFYQLGVPKNGEVPDYCLVFNEEHLRRVPGKTVPLYFFHQEWKFQEIFIPPEMEDVAYNNGVVVDYDDVDQLSEMGLNLFILNPDEYIKDFTIITDGFLGFWPDTYPVFTLDIEVLDCFFLEGSNRVILNIGNRLMDMNVNLSLDCPFVSDDLTVMRTEQTFKPGEYFRYIPNRDDVLRYFSSGGSYQIIC